jgi:hypothetical protein
MLMDLILVSFSNFCLIVCLVDGDMYCSVSLLIFLLFSLKFLSNRMEFASVLFPFRWTCDFTVGFSVTFAVEAWVGFWCRIGIEGAKSRCCGLRHLLITT